MLADCRAGNIDMVITKSISRFARNTVTLLETARELKSLGIDVFFEEQSIHMISAEGELMLSMFFLHDSFCQKRHRGEKRSVESPPYRSQKKLFAPSAHRNRCTARLIRA